MEPLVRVQVCRGVQMGLAASVLVATAIGMSGVPVMVKPKPLLRMPNSGAAVWIVGFHNLAGHPPKAGPQPAVWGK